MIRKGRTGTVTTYKMRDGRVRFRVRVTFGKTRSSLGLYETREEANAVLARAMAGEALKGRHLRHQQPSVVHTTEHRAHVDALVAEGFEVRWFSSLVRKYHPRVATTRAIPDAHLVSKLGIHVVEVEVQSFGANKWRAFAASCAKHLVPFTLTVIDRYGTRSQPFIWARPLPSEPLAIVARIEADLRLLREVLGVNGQRVDT